MRKGKRSRERKRADKVKDIEKGIVSDDITDIRLTDAEYHWDSGYNEFSFACRIRGEENVLHMTVQRHDDGEGFVIDSEKDDIWEHMTSGELYKLDDRLHEEIEYDHYHKEIEKAQTVDDCRNLMYEFMENENAYFRRALPKLWKELDARENKMLDAEKTSVITQLKNEEQTHSVKQKNKQVKRETVR